MNPKKLIRSGIVDKLLPGEVDTITDKAELNKLYALKVREELQEIIDSDYSDINEFGDLISVVTSFAAVNGFDMFQLNAATVEKELNKGIFSNLALNNLNPDNPSNKLYFEKNKPSVIVIAGSPSVNNLHRALNGIYKEGEIVHICPNDPEKSVPWIDVDHLTGPTNKEMRIKLEELSLKAYVKPFDEYTFSERSHMPIQPAPSARRDRRKKNRRK